MQWLQNDKTIGSPANFHPIMATGAIFFINGDEIKLKHKTQKPAR
jgi:hypothetical protein